MGERLKDIGDMNKIITAVTKFECSESWPADDEMPRTGSHQLRKKNPLWHGLAASTLLLALLMILATVAPQEVMAQRGTLSGRVLNSTTGEPLANVEVVLTTIGHSTRTDLDGRYRLQRVPVGEHQLAFHALGYTGIQVPVLIQDGERTVQNMELFLDLGEGDRVLVLQRRESQARTLNRQLSSDHNSATLSAAQIDNFGDRTLEDALSRFPGVQVGSLRETNIRGVGLDRYHVTVDGQRMPTSGFGDRRVNLNVLSADLVHDLELVRVLTPDMDADAPAGVIRIHTRRLVGDERRISARLGGGGDARYMSLTGVESRASLEYSEAYRDDFSLSMNLSWQQGYRPWETLGIDYQAADFGNGPVDVIERVSPGLFTDSRDRIGASIQLDYLPTDKSRFYVRGMLSQHDRDLVQHENHYSVAGDWLRPDTTGATGRQGSFNYDMRFQDKEFELYMVQVGGSHLFDLFDVNYSLGWGQMRSRQEELYFPFQLGFLDYTIDMSDRTRPDLGITNVPRHPTGVEDFRRQILTNVNRFYDLHVDNTFTGRLDLEVPVGPVALKVGSSARLTDKDGNFNRFQYSMLRRPDVAVFEKFSHEGLKILDHYLIPRFIDPYKARSYYVAERASFSSSTSFQQFNSSIWNYESTEYVYGAYGMATAQLGGLQLSAGVRMEHTDGRYTGRNVLFDVTGSFIESVDTTQSVDYTNLLPYARLGYDFGGQTRANMAYSRSLARPDFNLLAPFERRSEQDNSLLRGNPFLDPMISDNLDFWMEHYFLNAGMFSVGFFHKQIKDFNYYVRQEILDDEELSGWSLSKYFNSEETATVYGVEVSWQQRLVFLPGFLRNFSTYANYTWSDSVFDVEYREDEVALPLQSPHVLNAALSYEQGRYFGQVSYHWTAESLSIIRQEQTLAPSADLVNEIYMDRYMDGWSDLSVSFRMRISERFRFWADAYNLLPRERVGYEQSRDLYPVATNWTGGRSFRAGIRFDL